MVTCMISSRSFCAPALRTNNRHPSCSVRLPAVASVSSPLRHGRARQRVVTEAFFSAGGATSISQVSQVVTAVVVVAGAWFILNADKSYVEQDTQGREPCPRCGGTRLEECMCTRWSDGDVGCASCNNTGMMTCRSCGGTGLGVPVMVRIDPDQPPSQRQ